MTSGARNGEGEGRRRRGAETGAWSGEKTGKAVTQEQSGTGVVEVERGGDEAKRKARKPKVKRSGLYTKRTFGVYYASANANA